MSKGVCYAALLASAQGHGAMTWPPTRIGTSMEMAGYCVGANPFTESGTCFWWSQCCTPGCGECTGQQRFPASLPLTELPKCCDTPMEPTLDRAKYGTWNDFPEAAGDMTKYSPWRSPGHGPVLGPCGIAGGYYNDTGVLQPANIESGFDGRNMPRLKDTQTVWEAGSVQEVAWSMFANHGGGYAYRLCPADDGLTESTCQAGHLSFVGNETFIQYRSDRSNRTAIPAVRVNEGTHPEGSMWTRNPIPACAGVHGGSISPVEDGRLACQRGPMFDPPLPGLFGHGAATCFRHNTDMHEGQYGNCTVAEEEYWFEKFNFNLVDLVQIPVDTPEGDYVLSWRWDAEESMQIWTGCSDVTIVHPTIVV